MNLAIDRQPMRVYYCDTDAEGVVYYGNYFRFLEIARTEMLRRRGLDLGEMRQSYGIEFAVTRIQIRYRRPARYNDLLEIESKIIALHSRGLTMEQNVHLPPGADPLTECTIEMVSVGRDFKPTRLPAELMEKLK